MEKLTIKDIAKMAGVSHTTVSRALNGAQNIRPETYAKIMELCRTTGYTPNAAARQLKRSDSGAIGIIVPDISNAFFCELTRHLEWMIRQKGRNVFISSSFYDYEIEAENILALMENRVSGIILSGVGDQTHLHLQDYLGKVPIVFLGDNIPEGMVSQITVNNYEGTRIATRYLISLGHRELVFLGGRDSSVTHRRRHQGFLDTAATIRNVHYDIFTILSGSRIEDGYHTGLAYFTRCIKAKKSIATGILCISDHFALGVMQAAVETGVDIPGQISLIGFDDVSFASLPKIQLTTISQPKEEICEVAVQTLEELIAADGPAPISCKTIEPVLVRRDTCGPSKGGALW